MSTQRTFFIAFLPRVERAMSAVGALGNQLNPPHCFRSYGIDHTGNHTKGSRVKQRR